jgi:hypothetical protein
MYSRKSLPLGTGIVLPPGDIITSSRVDSLTRVGKYFIVYLACAEVAELADALESGSSERKAHAGSTPAFGTKRRLIPTSPSFRTALLVRAGDTPFHTPTCSARLLSEATR